MTDAVVTADAESISDIQDYLQTFNKEIDNSSGQNVATTIASNNPNMITDAIYTIEGQKLTVIGESGEHAEQGGNYSFMVMNSNDQQQYMLIMSNDGDQAAANEQSQTLVVTTDAVAPVTETNSRANNLEAPEPRKKGFRGKRQIKQEIFEEDNRNDISVYDFNELNMPNRNSSSVDQSIDANMRDQSTADEEEEDDPDFKTPVIKTRGRPGKDRESGKKSKSNSGTLVLNNTGNSSSGNVHVCTYCSYTSNKRYLLSRHLKSHSEDRPHKCGICERGFKTLASLQNHVNTHTGVRPHQCKFCDAAFTTSGELVRHIRYRHTHEKPHRCTECDYASVELSKLKRHMRCHTGERPYQCPHCTYASPDTYKLKRHLRIHTGEKPYVCDVCHQRFTQSNSLKAHRLIHTGNKPIFKCEFCPTTCGRKTDLRIHVQKLHTSDKMLTCKRCDQSFPDRYQFKMHLKTHEGEKCFKCDLCNYASVSARHLESHMLIHTDQKPYICEVCQLSFRQKQLLKRHKNLYHNPNYVPPTPKEKTHECSQCNKAFRHKGNLIRHMTLHDPDSKHSHSKDPNSLDNSQLIDDEYYEDEDDDLEPIGEAVTVTDGALLDPNGSAVPEGAISITLDPQTQQLINSSNEQVMFVVQYPTTDSSENVATVSNGQPTLVAVTPTASTPRIISRGGRVTRSLAKANDVQTLFDNVTDDKSGIVVNSGENIISIQQAPQIAFDSAETINLEEQLQKQKDLEACFGFKDEDDDDDAVIRMSAIDVQ